MSDHGSTEENANGISSENVEGEVSEIQTLTQEAVNEQMKGFIAPLNRQLEELTRLVPGMTITRHPNHYPRTEFGATSGSAIPQADTSASPHCSCDLRVARKVFRLRFSVKNYLDKTAFWADQLCAVSRCLEP